MINNLLLRKLMFPRYCFLLKVKSNEGHDYMLLRRKWVPIFFGR